MSDQKILISKDGAEARHISASDPHLGALISVVGDHHIEHETDVYLSLLRSITGQQLSTRAADAVWGRFSSALQNMTPEKVAALPEERLREFGYSRPKVSYIKDLTRRVLEGEIVAEDLYHMPDDLVIETLTRTKGIGLWTAQMLLMFSLLRPDVFSSGDLGLRKSVRWLYSLDEIRSIKDLTVFSERWKPYRTTAALYLWRAVDMDMLKSAPPVPR